LKNVFELIVWGIIGIGIAGIIFVKAGSSGQTGGQQAAEVVNSLGQSTANVLQAAS
jgi:hypothetical protein